MCIYQLQAAPPKAAEDDKSLSAVQQRVCTTVLIAPYILMCCFSTISVSDAALFDWTIRRTAPRLIFCCPPHLRIHGYITVFAAPCKKLEQKAAGLYNPARALNIIKLA